MGNNLRSACRASYRERVTGVDTGLPPATDNQRGPLPNSKAADEHVQFVGGFV